MTQEIIEMARQARLMSEYDETSPWVESHEITEYVEAFAKLVEDKVTARYMQLFLDPENQPTQFGTATQEYREQEIKDEREACADMVFRYISQTTNMEARGCLASVAHDIRARGEA